MSDHMTQRQMPDWARPGARCTMSIEPAVSMHAAVFGWDYEVQVALPASYGVTDKTYPVLWLTDGPLLFHLTVGLANTLIIGGLAPEMIIVSVGCASDAGVAEFGRRRAIDFTPAGPSPHFDGPGGDFIRSKGFMEKVSGQADDLVAFLVDAVRPALSKRYRMDDQDHGLMGHSGGGLFVNYALFARPGAFRRYIIGSPSANVTDRSVFRLESAYAEDHQDLKADIFFGAGEQEIGQLSLAAFGIVSSAILMAEVLLVRRYPSLKLTTRIFPGKDHYTVVADVISEGIRAVWADKTDLSLRPFS